METEAKTKTASKTNSIFEWAELISFSLILVTLILTFLFRMVSVNGTSMLNTLQNGERLVLSRLPYTPHYGDIVVVNRDNDEPLIKRVIGLPGDTIEINEDTGEVLRNGEVIDEPYIEVPTATERMDGAVTVPDGEVFIMGDNRVSGHSLDSRTFGPVSQSRLAGKVVWRLSPTASFGDVYDKH